MTLLGRLAVTAAVGAMMLGGFGFAPLAQAAYIVTLQQVGGDVVATGSGSIDLGGLTLGFASGVLSPRITPALGQIVTGPPSPPNVFVAGYLGVTGPTILGSTGTTHPNTGSGDMVGIIGLVNELYVPAGYVSDSSLSDSSTYNIATFATLGVTPGTYVWTWGSGADADSFTLEIAVAVPEPASTLVLGLPLAATLLARRRTKRADESA